MSASLEFDRFHAFLERREIDVLLRREPVQGNPDDLVTLDDEIRPAADVLPERVIHPVRFLAVNRGPPRPLRFLLPFVRLPALADVQLLGAEPVAVNVAIEPVRPKPN